MGTMVAPGVGAALRLMRAHWLGWIVAFIVVQGALALVVLPLLASVYRLVLSASAIDGLNTTSLVLLLSSPVEILAFVLFAVLAVIAVVAEVGFFSAFVAALLDGATFSFATGLRAVPAALRPLTTWQAPILALYVVLVLPLSGLAIGSTLTQHIAIPSLVTDAVLSTPAGKVGYAVFLVVVIYVAFRLLLTVTVIVDTRSSVISAMRQSLRVTGGMHLRLALLLAATVAAVVVLLALVAGLGFVVVAIVDIAGDSRAGVSEAVLAVVTVIRFLLVGFATVFLSAVFVVLRRQADAEDDSLPAVDTIEHRGRPGTATRAGSAIALGVALLLTVGQVASAAVSSASATDAGATVVVAHRGYTLDAVENTIASLDGAAKAGADVVELDVQETSDGGLVVVHDTNLTRLADLDRNVYDMTTSEVTSVTIRQSGHSARIPTLEAFVGEAMRLDMPLLVEVKPHGHEKPGFSARIANELRHLDPDEGYWVQSLDSDTLAGIRSADPDRTTAFVVGLQLGLLPSDDASAIVIENWSFSSAMLALAETRHQQVYAWTINDARSMRAYLRLGVNGVITDDVPLALSERQKLATPRSAALRYIDAARDVVLP